jgi:RimJ/RimL family protein N-acetyltransferase
MYQVITREYHKLLSMTGVCPEVKSVLIGNSYGDVFVSSNQSMDPALVYVRGMEGYYFIGDSFNDQFVSEVRDFMFSDNLESEYLEYSIPATKEWDHFNEYLLKGKMSDEWIQVIFELEKLSDCSLNNLDYDIINRMDKSYKELYDELVTCYGNNLKNKEHLYVSIAVKDEEMLGYSYVGFYDNETCVINVETKEEYRGRGIAYTLSHELIKEIISSGMRPKWECMESNIVSMKLAQKLGFKVKEKYTCYGVSLK